MTKDQFLFCCVVYQIKSLLGRHLYGAGMGLGQRHVCHMMNNVLFPRVNSQEQSPLLVSKGCSSSPEMTLVKHQRPSAGRQGTLIHPYNPTTLNKAAADGWKLYSGQPQHAAQLQRQSSTMQAPFTNTSQILLVFKIFFYYQST